MTPIADIHTHTLFSDGLAHVEDNVEAAVAAGCRVMACTDHLTMPETMDPGSEVGVAERDLPTLRAEFDAARQGHGQIELLYGFECDWYPGCEPNIECWAAGADILLGSVHWIGEADAGKWMDDPTDTSLYDEIGADEVWRRYADAWCRACESIIDFATMTHPDLAKRFRNEGWPSSLDLDPLYGRMAECAHDTNRRVEINTAGMRKTVGEYYPAPQLLRAFCRAEVPITVGSDAHTPSDICWGIRDAYAYAHAAGYREVQVPHVGGEWEAWALE